MEVLFERVAGLDVGKGSVTVCVRVPGRRQGSRSSVTRTFKTTTGSLRVMRDWLVDNGVTIAAMESTSTYWKLPFYCLEEVLEVWLLNAAHMKAVPGRKTDVRDAEWIAQLLEHGLLSPSFVPPPPIRRLRMLTRYRVQLMGDRTREAVRLELMLEDASIKLSAVASSVTTVSARVMLRSMIDGERDARVLAEMAKGKMRSKIPDLAQALEGNFDDHHARMAGAILDWLEQVEDALADLDAAIRVETRPWAHQVELLQTIPRVGERIAQVIIAETGADMSRFGSAAKLAAWAGVAPGIYESAGKRTPTGKRHGNKWLTAMLVEAPVRWVGCTARTTSPHSMPGSPNAAVPGGPRSPSRTPSSSPPITCSPGTSHIVISALTGSRAATTRPTPAASSHNSKGSGTPSNSTPSPNTSHPTRVRQARRADTLRPTG
jgi:transposase